MCIIKDYITKSCPDIVTGKHRELRSKTPITLKNMIRKYGEELGKMKYEEYNNKRITFYSKISQELFDNISNKIPDYLSEHTYYATKNKEYGKCDTINNTYYMYDFVISTISFCIEFHGTEWHASPDRYKDTDFVKVRGEGRYAKDIWNADKIKIDFLVDLGFEVMVVWEHEYKKDKDATIRRCVDAIKERIKLAA